MRRAALVVSLLLPALIVDGCGSETEECPSGDCTQSQFDATTDVEALPDSDNPDRQFVVSDATPMDRCPEGASCGAGRVCVKGDLCCPVESACGQSCCGGGQQCSFGKCVTPGKSCFDADDCAANEFCDGAVEGTPGPFSKPDAGGDGAADTSTDVGTVDGSTSDGGDGGAMTCVFRASTPGRCLPKPNLCAADAGDAGDCIPRCEYKPATSKFDPVLKYYWGGNTKSPYDTDVMMAPIVLQTDDDNGDGKITGRDVPEIVFSTFRSGAYTTNGTLRAISIVCGQMVEKWNRPDLVHPGSSVAGGDLDGDGKPEIVACANPAGPSPAAVVAVRGDGSDFWKQNDRAQIPCGYEGPAIGDVDGDGAPEVIVGWTVLDGKTGVIKRTLSTAAGLFTSLADLDGDGVLDVTDGRKAYRGDGSKIWDLSVGFAITGDGGYPGAPDAAAATAVQAGTHGIGDFNLDKKPDVVIVHNANHTLSVVTYDPTSPSGARILKTGVDINNGVSTRFYCNNFGGSESGGGPPVVADFNGDGVPDIGVAGAVGYVAIDGKKIVDPNIASTNTTAYTLWLTTTRDCSSRVTGSSVFDFNGDGVAEVIYADERNLWMYNGPTGASLIPSTCNTSGTLYEFPLVADVDGDDQADIVVVSNAYAFACVDSPTTRYSGIRVFGSASNGWVKTRRVWNQHTYHVTNVEESGRIPAKESQNWSEPGLNNFRQNKQPGAEFSAPDAVVLVRAECTGSTVRYILEAQNAGQAVMLAGAQIKLYAGTVASGSPLATFTTTRALAPLQSERFVFTGSELSRVTASIEPLGGTNECRGGNNTTTIDSSCPKPF